MSYYNGKRDDEKRRRARLVLAWAKKLKAIECLGGKCECGEDRPWLLDFHHIDDKEYEISYLKHFSWEKVKKEIGKCKLLCRNCHGDLHYKEHFLTLEKDILAKVVEDNFCPKIDHALVLDLNQKGKSQAKIAEAIGCGISTVCEILKSNGIHTELKKKVIDPGVVIQLREDGLSNPQIAEKLGIHRFSVPHIIKKWQSKKEAQNDSQHP
jgi:transcriptional regulator